MENLKVSQNGQWQLEKSMYDMKNIQVSHVGSDKGDHEFEIKHGDKILGGANHKDGKIDMSLYAHPNEKWHPAIQEHIHKQINEQASKLNKK